MLVHLTVLENPRSYSLAWWWQHVRHWRHICPETRHIEMALGLIALWWSFVLLAPQNLFATNPAYLGLAGRGSEMNWGIIASVVGVLHLIAYLGAAPVLRFGAFVVGMVLWLFIAVSLSETAPRWHGMPVSPGVGTYSVFALKCFLAMCRLSPFVLADLIGMGRRRDRNRRNRP